MTDTDRIDKLARIASINTVRILTEGGKLSGVPNSYIILLGTDPVKGRYECKEIRNAIDMAIEDRYPVEDKND